MKRVIFYIRLIWRPLLATAVILGSGLYLLTYKIGSLVSGYSEKEFAYFAHVSNGPLIPSNPVYLPIYLIHKLTLEIWGPHIYVLRTTNAVMALASVVITFLLIRRWQTTRVAYMTSALMLCSSWFLLVARDAVPAITLTLLPILVLLTTYLQTTKKRKYLVLLTGICVGILIYLPGAIWFIILGIIWKRKFIIAQARTVPFWYAILSLVIMFTLMVPALIRATNTEFLLSISGLPSHVISIQTFFVTIGRFLGSLFWNTSLFTTHQLGTQSLLDIFMIAMFIAGTICILRNRQRSRNILMLVWLGIGLILIGLNGMVNSVVVLPAIFIVVGQGIAWTLQQWLAVFPKNPVARAVGISMVVCAVAFSVTYNSYRYFIAWPNMDQTKSAYKLTI